MTIEIPSWITRKFIQDNRMLTFVYGASYHNKLEHGQAAVARRESNAFHIPVMKLPCKADPNASLFHDRELDLMFIPIVRLFLSYVPRTKPIILFPKIGQGRSELLKNAPKCYAFLMEELDKIAWKERPVIC